MPKRLMDVRSKKIGEGLSVRSLRFAQGASHGGMPTPDTVEIIPGARGVEGRRVPRQGVERAAMLPARTRSTCNAAGVLQGQASRKRFEGRSRSGKNPIGCNSLSSSENYFGVASPKRLSRSAIRRHGSLGIPIPRARDDRTRSISPRQLELDVSPSLSNPFVHLQCRMHTIRIQGSQTNPWNLISENLQGLDYGKIFIR